MPQVVEAAAGAEELAVSRRALRLRTEHPKLGGGIAPQVGVVAAPAQRCPVQRADILCVVRAGEAGLVVAPQRLVLVPVNAQVEPSHGVDVAIGRRVVAIDRIVEVRIQPAEDVLRIGLSEALEQVTQVALGGVGLRRDQIPALELGLEIEGQPAVGKNVVLVAGVARKGLDRT